MAEMDILSASCRNGSASATLSDDMIREAVIAERDRRGWNTLQLSKESGVSYGRLHEWLNDGNKTINSANLEKLLKVLGLTLQAKHKRKQGGK